VAISPSVDGMNLKDFAASRNTKTQTLYASRGSILDASGEELAASVNSYKLIAYLSESRTTNKNNPKHVVDKAYTSKMLAPILNLSEEKILEYLSKDAYQVEFGANGRNLTEMTKQKIEKLNLPGLDFIESVQRYYKMGDFASYIVGYAKANDEGEINGELGVESYYNKELSGVDGFITYQSDAYGYQLPNVPALSKEAESGSDIYLTLDSNIQLIAENALNNLEENYKFDFAIISVMDAKTGALVASATAPSFNPNNLNTLSSYLNPLSSYTYEPGSTMKIFSWAAAMEEGLYKGDDYYLSGGIEVADVTIRDFNDIGWGEITYDTGFAYSSNVGATLLALALEENDGESLINYYEKFGFGDKTGIELSAEAVGDIGYFYKSELATASFGQGITITPIQMLQALTAITNEGTMLKPYLVSKIVADDGTNLYEAKKTEVGKVMTKETAQNMLNLMYNANYQGLGVMWQPKKVVMAAKTGTAQIASPTGGYLTGKYDSIYSLAGIFPYENPEYIIYVAVKQIEGSQRAVADMTTKVVDEIASYAKLTKEENNSKSEIKVLDNYISKPVSEVKQDLENAGFKVVVIGSGDYITNQYPLKSASVVLDSIIYLKTNNLNEIIVPDFTGWSLSDIKTYSSLAGVNLQYTGTGYVKTQSPEIGTAVNSTSTLVVALEPKKE